MMDLSAALNLWDTCQPRQLAQSLRLRTLLRLRRLTQHQVHILRERARTRRQQLHTLRP